MYKLHFEVDLTFTRKPHWVVGSNMVATILTLLRSWHQMTPGTTYSEYIEGLSGEQSEHG